MKRVIVLVAAMYVLPSYVFPDEAKITSVTGTAEVKYAGKDAWYAAQKGAMVTADQEIKTKPRSRVRIELSDGSRIEIYPNSQVDLKDVQRKSPLLKIALGRLKAWVSRNVSRSKFEVHTPVAVCSVRGTEFTVNVDEKGMTDIEVAEGLVGVRKIDGLGEEVPVGAGEKLGVASDRRLSIDQKSEAFTDEKNIRQEVGLEMSKEEVQAAAAQELRLAEYQEGKTMIDVFGLRVRLEEYILRPAPDTFKLVVLNERDSRFDYFYYQGKFNQDLPADLGVALKDLGGKIGDTAPGYYLTEYEKAFSNTQDYSKDTASGGHLTKVTYNSDGTFTVTDAGDPSNTKTVNAADSTGGAYDPVADTFDATQTTALTTTVFNAETDTFETFSPGQTLWTTRFNSYEHALNGVRKQWYLPSNAAKNILVADLDGHWLYPSLDSQGNTIFGEWGVGSAESAYPDASVLHNRIRLTYLDNTYEQYDTYIISDDGKIASSSSFNNVTTGTQYKTELLNWNYEQVLTASEFQGRKIDLVVEPKILIKSGLIK